LCQGPDAVAFGGEMPRRSSLLLPSWPTIPPLVRHGPARVCTRGAKSLVRESVSGARARSDGESGIRLRGVAGSLCRHRERRLESPRDRRACPAQAPPEGEVVDVENAARLGGAGPFQVAEAQDGSLSLGQGPERLVESPEGLPLEEKALRREIVGRTRELVL